MRIPVSRVAPSRLWFRRVFRALLTVFFLASLSAAGPDFVAAVPQSAEASPNAPRITKVEPPNWWVGLTPDVMLLLSGSNLAATHVQCNLPAVKVMRTQSSAGGTYLFIWLRIAPEARSGTAVCRVTTPGGTTPFEFPLAARKPAAGRFQGLATGDVLYLIMPDRFANGDPANDEPLAAPGSYDRAKPRSYHGGDLRGIREHLGYLKDLGITTLWLTPIVKNGAAQDYHGYSAVDLYDVDPHLGSLADYQDLVAAAHQQHIKIFFDAVPNHVGPLHPWVDHPPLPDWFHGSRANHLDSFTPVHGPFYAGPEKQPNDLFELLADPHAPVSLRKNLTEGWFFGILPDLNTENPVVAQYLLQNGIWWAESSGLDGFRLDTFPCVDRRFWAGWHAGLRRIYPNLATIGEVFHPDPSVTSFFVGGQRRWDGIDSGLTTVFDFPLYFALRDVLLNGAPAARIADVLRHDSLYPRPSLLVPFFGNHDVPRFVSAEGGSPEKLKLAFGLTLTLRGIPQLCYGDEIGMPGGADPDNRRDFPGGWNDDARNAFTEAGRTPQQQAIFAYVQALLRLRREHPALESGKLWHLASDAGSYVFLRETQDERIVVAFNNAAQSRDLRLPLADTPASGAAGAVALFGDARAQVTRSGLQLALPPRSLSIFLLD
jgi:glycosidase